MWNAWFDQRFNELMAPVMASLMERFDKENADWNELQTFADETNAKFRALTGTLGVELEIEKDDDVEQKSESTEPPRPNYITRGIEPSKWKSWLQKLTGR